MSVQAPVGPGQELASRQVAEIAAVVVWQVHDTAKAIYATGSLYQ